MNETARDRILSRLHNGLSDRPVVPAPPSPPPVQEMRREALIEELRGRMEAIQTQVHLTTEAAWTDTLCRILSSKKLDTLLVGGRTPLFDAIQAAREKAPEKWPQIVIYDQEAETVKEAVFSVPAGITTARGAVADPGAVILWPTAEEPRLLSLVPPVHIVVLRADTVYPNFSEAMAAEKWADGMPTNALLISGPSKTADIEFVLTFGVHGPKELILLIVEG